jgi:hypothetical protein
MSVAAMADNRLLRNTPTTVGAGQIEAAQLPDGAKVPGVKEGALNSIVQWIPIETIGVYVFLQQLFLDPLNARPGQSLHELDHAARWNVFWVVLVLTILTIPLYTALKAKVATADFKLPVAETLIGALAFVLWAAALPDTPLNDWDTWNPDYGVAAITVSALFLNPIATLLGLKAQWGKAPSP